jgi:molecular chaperone HscB
VSLASLNFFEIFSLPASFQVDVSSLEAQYRKLQAEYHPDRFSCAADSERVQALQLASLINDAYETLKSPLKRAAYLLSLTGVDPEEHNQGHLDGSFLIRQMEMREDLENLASEENLAGLDKLKVGTEREKDSVLDQFESSFNAGELSNSKSLYNQLQFLFKLLEEINRVEEKLLDY